MHTGMEWLVRLVFRVGRNTFKQEDLDEQLAIPTLNDTRGSRGLQQRTARPRRQSQRALAGSVDPGPSPQRDSDAGLRRSSCSRRSTEFHQQLQRMQTKPEDVMPWKVNGERWHLGDKGFPPGKPVQWDRGLLPRLLEIVRAVEPEVEIQWDNRAAITLRVPGMTRAWAQWQTKEADMLVCRFIGKKGQFNLSQLEGFGVEPTLAGPARRRSRAAAFPE